MGSATVARRRGGAFLEWLGGCGGEQKVKRKRSSVEESREGKIASFSSLLLESLSLSLSLSVSLSEPFS